MHPPIILGSSSPARRQQMHQLGLDFATDSANIDEQQLEGESIRELVSRLSLEKAKTVATRHPNSLIIGCDQVCSHHGMIFGKPHTHDNAVAQLRQFSGQTIVFEAGICLLDSRDGSTQHDISSSEVKFRELSDDEIEHYLCQDTPYQCAGSIRSEGLAVWLLDAIHSDDPNALMGLPIFALRRMLEHAGVQFHYTRSSN